MNGDERRHEWTEFAAQGVRFETSACTQGENQTL
jgi:hypothetical protein